MEYINLFLILLTIMLLSITSYENFYDCKTNFVPVDNTNICCPKNTAKKKYSVVNNICCSNKITESEYDKKSKKEKGKYIANVIEGTTKYYCDSPLL